MAEIASTIQNHLPTFWETSSYKYWLLCLHKSSTLWNQSQHWQSRNFTAHHILLLWQGYPKYLVYYFLFTELLLFPFLLSVLWLSCFNIFIGLNFPPNILGSFSAFLRKSERTDRQNNIRWREHVGNRLTTHQRNNKSYKIRRVNRLLQYLSFWSCPPTACPLLVLWFKQAKKHSRTNTYSVSLSLQIGF